MWVYRPSGISAQPMLNARRQTPKCRRSTGYSVTRFAPGPLELFGLPLLQLRPRLTRALGRKVTAAVARRCRRMLLPPRDVVGGGMRSDFTRVHAFHPNPIAHLQQARAGAQAEVERE